MTEAEGIPGRIILVHRLPKVGGTSALDAIIKAFWPAPRPYATHTLTPERIERAERWHREHQEAEPAPWIQKARYLRELLDQGSDIQWQIITLVRDPVARDISEFFHHCESTFPGLITNPGPDAIERLMQGVSVRLSNWFEHDDGHAPKWFDQEIRDAFGFDLLDQTFDHARGYGIYQHGNTGFLILRQEDLARVFVEAATPFLQPPKPLVLERKNVGSEKPYAAAYRAVLEQLVIPPELCDRIYNARWVRHFYSEQERARFASRWSRSA